MRWRVEMLGRGAWRKTQAVAKTRDEARALLREYQRYNPDDRFRLVRERDRGEG